MYIRSGVRNLSVAIFIYFGAVAGWTFTRTYNLTSTITRLWGRGPLFVPCLVRRVIAEMGGEVLVN